METNTFIGKCPMVSDGNTAAEAACALLSVGQSVSFWHLFHYPSERKIYTGVIVNKLVDRVDINVFDAEAIAAGRDKFRVNANSVIGYEKCNGRPSIKAKPAAAAGATLALPGFD